jgi:four helix bundle protein
LEENEKDEGRPPAPRRDLEERTERFALQVRSFLSHVSLSALNESDVRQLVRSSGSIGANYIEAQNALGRKDFTMRIRIARKEAKETGYWLRLLTLSDQEKDLGGEREALAHEVTELTRILGAIVRKME